MAMDLREASLSRRALALCALAACVLQVALAPQIDLLGGRFNFMFALTMVAGLAGKPGRAACTGFAAGLFYDLTAAVPVGLMALVLTVAGWLAATLSRGTMTGLSAASARYVAAAALAVNLLYGLALFLLGSAGGLFSALVGHGLASAVLDAIATCPFLLLSAPGDRRRGLSGAGRPRAGRRPGMRFKAPR